MARKDNTGGPAFPFTYDSMNASDIVPHVGMSLRDFFAAFSMAAWRLALETNVKANDAYDIVARNANIDPEELMARMAYLDADEMLKEREREASNGR